MQTLVEYLVSGYYSHENSGKYGLVYMWKLVFKSFSQTLIERRLESDRNVRVV